MLRESFDVLPWADAWLLCLYRPSPSSSPVSQKQYQSFGPWMQRKQLLTKHAGHTATSTMNKGANVVRRGCGLFALAIDTSIFCV
ncbi:hypothetical protein NEOLEDRAFT_1130739 [Neolentinus lepideus HHB14362 ss-1]|uniref:Uncharacterized protein n=1 Tax=Neolentinus lepideus HHB14362 ss-1 TaxID=1314782 RepID=A0A165U5K9_9AGAM|nr:hypothetical protein NEOLEDRAFT_1130739 [Neolentinus lepideus HHB14362 ss-1]